MPIIPDSLGCSVSIGLRMGVGKELLQADFAVYGGPEAGSPVQVQVQPRRVSADTTEVISGVVWYYVPLP